MTSGKFHFWRISEWFSISIEEMQKKSFYLAYLLLFTRECLKIVAAKKTISSHKKILFLLQTFFSHLSRPFVWQMLPWFFVFLFSIHPAHAGERLQGAIFSPHFVYSLIFFCVSTQAQKIFFTWSSGSGKICWCMKNLEASSANER